MMKVLWWLWQPVVKVLWQPKCRPWNSPDNPKSWLKTTLWWYFWWTGEDPEKFVDASDYIWWPQLETFIPKIESCLSCSAVATHNIDTTMTRLVPCCHLSQIIMVHWPSIFIQRSVALQHNVNLLSIVKTATIINAVQPRIRDVKIMRHTKTMSIVKPTKTMDHLWHFLEHHQLVRNQKNFNCHFYSTHTKCLFIPNWNITRNTCNGAVRCAFDIFWIITSQ
jgi:hypothetical protein